MPAIYSWEMSRASRSGSPGSGVNSGSGEIDRLTINTEQATPEQIGIYAPTTATVAAGSTVSVRYRTTSGPGAWNTAHPLLRISTSGNEAGGPTVLVDAFAGSIFDLTPSTQYDVELTHVESGQATKVTTIQRTTRSLPATAGAATVTATTSDNLQTKFDALTAGDVLQLAAGTYTVSSLTLTDSGTSGSPIYIRGASRAGVIIKDTTGVVLTLNASHIVLENLTIEGSSSNSGEAASSIGIKIGGQTNVTVRNIDMVGVDQGIVSNGAEQTGTLIYGCVLNGNNVWADAYAASPAHNDTWNDTGLEIPGFGNCAWNNTLDGFGDSFSVATTTGDNLQAEGIHFYRNRVNNNCDDLIEFDYGTRNLSCYDNVVTNTATAMSSSYQYGGPSYYFRNTVVNTIRGPYKINGNGTGVTGFLVYNNTIVRTDGDTANWGMIQTGTDGAWQNYSFRNNLLVYRGSGAGGLLAQEASDNNPCDFDYNAWYPDDTILWASSYANLAAAQSGLAGASVTPLFGSSQRMAHDVITVTNPFTTAITLGADHTTEYAGQTNAALSASGPQNDGVSIPGITDGFSGAAPDIGAVIAGRSAVSVGAMPAWISNLSLFTWTQLTGTAPTDAGSQVNDPTHLDGITAYSGAGYDPSRRYFMFNGGGHNDGAGNGVFAVRVGLDTPDVVALIADSTSVQTDVDYYADGKPSAAHTYGTLIYVPSLDGLMRFGNTASYGSGNSKFGTVDRFNLANNTWDAAGTYTSLPGGAADYEMHTCRDDSDNVYEATWGTSSLRKWTNGTPGSWSVLWSGGAGIQGGALVFDTSRQVIVYFGNSSQAAWWNLSGTRTGITFTGLSGDGNAWVYCPSRDTYIGAFTSGGAVVMRECDPTTFAVSSLSVSGTSGGVGASGFGAIHNRLQIDDTLGIVMVHADVGSTDLWAFRYK